MRNWFSSVTLGFVLSFSSLVSQGQQVVGEPQLVIISMDDALHSLMEDRVNKVPNVPWTFYVSVVSQSGGWSYDTSLIDIDCVNADGSPTGNVGCLANPDSVKRMYQLGHEMALHTYTHPALAGGERPLTEQEIFLEIKNNYNFLVDSGVSPDDIKGFRAPFLDTQSSGWDKQKKNNALRFLQIALNQYNIEYDSTFSLDPEQAEPKRGVRHCTTQANGWMVAKCGFDERANYSWPENQGGYPDFDLASRPNSWHVYMPWKTSDGTASGSALNVMDTVFGSCSGNCSAAQAKSIWMQNFLRHYNGNKTPYGIHLHGQSLDNASEVAGLNEFIQDLKNNYSDVYFVTASQAAAYAQLTVKPVSTQWDQYFQNSFSGN